MRIIFFIPRTNESNHPFYGQVTPINVQVTFASGIQFYDNLHLCGNNRFYIYIYIYMCVCVCVCVYIYTHTHIRMQMEYEVIFRNFSSFCQ